MPQWPTNLKKRRLQEKEQRRMAKDPLAWLRADIARSIQDMNLAQAQYRHHKERAVKLQQRLDDEMIARGMIPDIAFQPGPEGPPGASESPKVKMI